MKNALSMKPAALLLAAISAIAARASINQWTPIGPFGGTASVPAIDPQNSDVVYVATTGGIYKSSDAGATWRLANSGLTAGFVARALVVDPLTPSTLYAGGAAGAWGPLGMYKSTDAAATWSPIPTGLDAVQVVDALAIDPHDPSALYLGATACFQASGSPGFVEGGDNLCFRPGVFKTTNAGASWSSASSGLPWDSVKFGSVGTLAIDPQTPSTVYAGIAGRIFKTTNGGISWSATGPSVPCCYAASALVIDPQNPSTLYTAAYGVVGIFKTTDGGDTWSAASSGLSTDCSGFLVIDPENPGTIYAGGLYGVCKTTDGGAHWHAATAVLPQELIDASVAVGPGNRTAGLAVDPQNPDTVYATTGGLGIFKSTDGADSWKPVNQGLSATSVYASALDPQSSATIYAETSAGVIKTTDGGTDWSPANFGLPLTLNAQPEFNSIVIDPSTPSTLYLGLGGSPAGIFKSVDGGANWIPIPAPAPASFQGTLALDPQDPSTLYAGGYHPQTTGFAGEILKSTDGGSNWTAAGSFPNGVQALVIDSHSAVYAVHDAWIARSTDGGTSWTDLFVPAADVGDCDCVPLRVLAIDPQRQDTLYAGGAAGVVKSLDGGVSWNLMNTGLPSPEDSAAGVTALVTDPQNPKTVYAVLGGKVFRSTDGAVSWNEVSAGLTATSVSTLIIDSKNPSTVYAGTHGGGIFAITFVP